MSRSLVWAVVMVTTLVAGAQEPTPTPQEGDQLGWHVVRPGETLEGITEHYLGEPTLWRDNWRLNPQVDDPHLLHPGDRLRVILHRQLPPRTAEVVTVENRVEAKPHPNPWIPATPGDLLQEQDGVRTFRRSSAELGFDDGTSIVLTESSLVFVREVRRDLVGRRSESIEVIEGTADLEARATRRRPSEIEIVLGDVRAEPRLDGASRTARSRLRRRGDGAADVMVYDGATAVAAAGATVEVPSGMGTSVAEGEPPAPPEKLLPRPRLRAPEDGAELAWANPELSWEPVANAASYTVEVCRDRKCAELVERTTVSGASASWRTETLTSGELHWRVTAVAASGLDGYPSTSRLLTISGGTDHEPPVVVAAPEGALRAVAADRLLRGTGPAQLQLSVVDHGAGVGSVRYRWDDGQWTPWSGDVIRVPAEGGLLSVEAEDLAGNRSPVVKVQITASGEPPQPPSVRRAHP